MFSFLKRRKKKKLTLEQIHNLYLILLPHIPEKEEKFLIDQVDKMLENMPSDTFIHAMEILHPSLKNESPVRIAFLFIEGLKRNDFFGYVSFIRSMVKNG